VLEYVFNLPADYGGLGEVYHDDKHEHLSFFEYKTKNRQLPHLELRESNVFIPLEVSQNNIQSKPISMPNPNLINIMSTVNMYYHNPGMMKEMMLQHQKMMYEARLKQK
jgi:hypothetical protein